MSTSSPNARKIAHYILCSWRPDGVFAEDLIDREARRQALSSPNRALLNALVLGVLRNRSVLDLWIDHLREGGKLQSATREVLRIGLIQLFFMGLPEHAAVNETVELAGHARSLVNAILRRALRSRAELEHLRHNAPWPVRLSLPDFLLERWKRNYGDEAVDKLGTWINEPAPITVRVNRLKYRAHARVSQFPGAQPVEGADDFFVMPELPLGLLEDGVCYAQDPGTAMPPRLLAPEKHHSVLDACAAPGGKSALMAQLMDNHGQLLCVDSVDKRIKRLTGNLRHLGVGCAEVLQHDWLAGPLPEFYQARFPGGFDRVLVDAPCSNTGVVRRRVDVRWRLKPESISEMKDLQGRLLETIAPLVKPGGRLVYSTCSIEPEENEGVAQSFASAHSEFSILDMRRTLPHRDGVDGGFAALMERKSE